MNIGWIGTGEMGARMAARLAACDHALNVYNRTRSKAEKLSAAGAITVCETPAEVSEKSDIIFISVTNGEAARAVVFGKNGLYEKAGREQIIVEMSTLSPAFSEELASGLHEKGLMYLNAPVVGSQFMADKGLLKVLASGDKSAYDAAKPYFDAIGESSVYMGRGAEARYLKIAVNMMICSYLTVYGEILYAGEGMGFGWEELNDLLESSDGASPMLKDKGTLHRNRIWESASALSSIADKDLTLALECARDLGFDMPLTFTVRGYDRFMRLNPRYETYSTFGTIGMLEDIAGRKCGDYPRLDAARKGELSGALTVCLTAAASLIAREALLLCEKSGIDKDIAAGYLATCHGATVYFKNSYIGGGTVKDAGAAAGGSGFAKGAEAGAAGGGTAKDTGAAEGGSGFAKGSDAGFEGGSGSAKGSGFAKGSGSAKVAEAGAGDKKIIVSIPSTDSRADGADGEPETGIAGISVRKAILAARAVLASCAKQGQFAPVTGAALRQLIGLRSERGEDFIL